SSFQKQQATSAKIPRERMVAACMSVGVLEAGFTVEPCPTMSNALDESEGTKKRRTPNAQRPIPN
ncbi:MAG TPA: hypothetical protein VH252_10360, partial [Chthoniobacterales bacterium]|nr:hypothetical protein [Chthoniobacterales bacterium]